MQEVSPTMSIPRRMRNGNTPLTISVTRMIRTPTRSYTRDIQSKSLQIAGVEKAMNGSGGTFLDIDIVNDKPRARISMQLYTDLKKRRVPMSCRIFCTAR